MAGSNWLSLMVAIFKANPYRRWLITGRLSSRQRNEPQTRPTRTVQRQQHNASGNTTYGLLGPRGCREIVSSIDARRTNNRQQSTTTPAAHIQPELERRIKWYCEVNGR